MSSIKSITKSQQCYGWNAALVEAERQLSEYEGKVKRLRNSIPVIKSKIATGEPWPGAGVQESDRKRQANG